MSVHLASRVIVDGTEVLVESTGDDTVLMLHGWPDTLALWDGTVAALRDRWRCVRLSLPGYDRAAPGLGAPCPLARITALLREVADAVSPGRPVTLLVHDWGCVFGYEFALRHPERVARVIGVDVGDHNSPALQRALTPGQKVGNRCLLVHDDSLGGCLGIRGNSRPDRVFAKSASRQTPCQSMDDMPFQLLHGGTAARLRAHARQRAGLLSSSTSHSRPEPCAKSAAVMLRSFIRIGSAPRASSSLTLSSVP